MDISDVDRRFAAFMQAVVRRALGAPEGEESSFIVIAWRGFTYRRHIEDYHPAQVERAEELSLNAIPAEHPLHGRHYSTVRGLPAHHGLTFSGPATHGHWVFGFDCGHGFDIKPAMDARYRRRGWLPMHEMPGLNDPDIFPPALRLQYRDLAYVRAYVDALAAALGAIARGVVRVEDLLDDGEEEG